MKIKSMLLFGILALSLASCGTQKNAATTQYNGPLVRTEFYRAKFGQSPFKVYNRIIHYDPIKEDDGSYTIINQEFAGYSWHYVQFMFVDKMFYIINFEQEFKYESAAKDRMETLYKMLSLKYGDVHPTDDGKGYQFTDEAKNRVTVRAHQGTSKSGNDFWYCDLSYEWWEGVMVNIIKSYSDL